jgi:hypothetical protein
VRIIRRPDEYLGTPPLVGAMVPANSLSTDAQGSLILTPTTAALAGFTGEQSSYDLNGEDPTRRIKGAAWTMDAAFSAAKLRNVTARVQRVALAGLFFPLDFELQIFRVTKTPGNKEKYNPANQQVQVTAFTDYSFTPLLNPAPVIKSAAIAWDGTQKSTLNFDLTNYALVLENTPSRAAAPDQAGELPRYYFVVRVINNPKGTGFFKWLLDTASARTIANIGTFQRSWWARNNDQEQWVETLFADVPTFAVNVETYPASGQAIYLIDVGKVPDTARGSIGRIAFERSIPPTSTAQLEISTAGSGGPWTIVKHGDAVSSAQQTYHLRVTLTRDASTRRTPTIAALGVEWRIPLDVSVEGTPTLPTREVSLPWPKASIPEGRIDVVRTGVRDYLDTASVLGSTQATTKLECDIYLASRHPSVTRDKWLHMERLAVSNRVPGSTSEGFTLLSYASKLKKKIPQKVESLNSVHKVTSSTTGAVVVTPALPGTSAGGNEYDGKGYYMRVRSTSNVNVAVGFMQTIVGNTGTTQLDFTPAMPSALNVNDVIEVHSGIFATQAISWTDADPADVWTAILAYAGIPPERIGAGYLPRGGLPPRVTDIAPGDATTQAKRKITNKLTELESADELLAQVSAILGGVTMEISGQICYVQLFPLRDATGNISVPLSPVVKVFDKRDYGRSLQTPPGLEKRATVMSATYGVPLTAAAPDTYPKQTTVTVDNDALLWLTQQDLEDFGSAQVPDNIARWIYNTADAGLYLAASITATYVRALSTGLRVFPFNAVEKNPELVPGDSIVILTDQYTDYEPSSATPLRGMLAVRGVLVQVGAEGRQLAVFVPGLRDNVTQAQGGNAGTLTGLGDPVDAPILSGNFLPTGELIITSYGSYNTASQRVAVGTVEPTDAFTRAGTPILFQNLTNIATGLIVPAGGSAWIKAFGYDNYGTESPVARMKVTREGSGTGDPPVVLMFPLNGDSSDVSWNIRFDAVPGSGGGGTNLTYDIRKKIGFAAETSIASGNATTLPRDLTLTRHPRSDAVIRFILTDVATGLTAQDSFTLPSARPELTDTGDQFTSGVKESGGRPVNRLYAKGLVGDPDTADAIGNGLTKRAIPFSILRSGDDALLTGVDYAASIAGIPAHATARQIGRYFNETFETLPTNWNIASTGVESLVAGVASVGTNVLQSSTAEDWRVFPYSLPFNPTKLYRIRSRIRATVDVSSGGTNCYVGLECRDANDVFINRVYVGLFAVPITVASGWVETTGWYKGTTFTSHFSSDPAAPVGLLPGTTQVRPLFILRDSGGVGGTHQIDYIQIDEMDEVASARTYGTMSAPGVLQSATVESGGKAVNRLFAKTLAGDPNTADSVAVGSISRVIPFSILRASDSALMTRVNDSAAVGSRTASDVARGTGTSVWTETFDTLAGWNVGGTGSAAVAPSANSTRGTKTLLAQNYCIFQNVSPIPFDPNKLYRFRARAQKYINDSGGNTGVVYMGVLAFLYDGNPANSNSGANYVLFSGSNIVVANGWITSTVWIKGATLAFAGASNPASTDPTTPSPLNTGTVWFYPYMLLNYPAVGTPNGTIEVDFFEITEFDEDAADRTYTVIDLGQKLKTAAKESGGAAVNRLLAKTLAGDPNTLGGVPDDATLNRYAIKNAVGNQITPSSTVGRMRCSLMQTSTQSVGAGGSAVMAWDIESGGTAYDIGGLHDNATNNNRITIPTGGDTGVWLLRAHMDFQGNNSAGNRGIYIRNNAASRVAGQEVYFPAGANPLSSGELEVQKIISGQAVGDWFEVLIVNSSGAAQTVGGNNGTTNFEAVHLW